MSEKELTNTRLDTRLGVRAERRGPRRALEVGQSCRDDRVSEEWIARLNHALKNMADRGELNRNPLAHFAYVEKLANERYQDKIMPRGLALRQVITECVARICAELGDEPGLAKPCRYLDLRAKGLKCTEAAAQLGLTREHVSREIRPKALGLLLDEFLSVTGRKD